MLNRRRKMVGRGDDPRRRKISPEIIIRCIISCISGIITQLSLLLIPSFFPSFSLIFQLLLSAMVIVLAIGFGQYCRRLLGVRASAPAFVFFHIIFIWVVYLGVIREAVSASMDVMLNGELVILLVGFVRILVSDPGFVHHDSPDFVEDTVSEDGDQPQTSLSSRRVRCCRSCKAYVRGFDHHCPAFGNCIGEMNYVLFIALLAGFIVTEASYAACSYPWVKRYKDLERTGTKVVFLAWHIYCICFNIRTDEWVSSHDRADQSSLELMFRNPYNKGIFYNLKDFLLRQGQASNG
ncbi:hypothetical protein Cgig2_003954 [Carnegiea gigantea]|uniref:S-acyltransferase n=1 Tax=Carnegiea gigantea TaxID=171969 RepID=A0A9Q1QEY5_9CARY|nr:hypothetical protein Cgig2_003954 [Carnegiea gigantea]